MNADLAEQLVEDPRWEWKDGMRATDGVRVVDVALWTAGNLLPDLDDFPTAGAILGVLADMGVLSDVVIQDEDWIVAVELPESGLQGWAGSSLGEAAGWALLAAWGSVAAPRLDIPS